VGGFNSGSRPRSEKSREDGLHRLSIRDVVRSFGAQLFSQHVQSMAPSDSGVAVRAIEDGGYSLQILRDEGRATIPYGLAEARSSMSPRQFISLIATKPHLGGTRYWFRCPRHSCGRRCSVLYREVGSNARAFACRRCIRFQYTTQVLGTSDLCWPRIWKLLVRVDLDKRGKVRRPRGMHQRTFLRITRDLDGHVVQWKATMPLMRSIVRSLHRMENQLDASGVTGYGDGTPFGQQ